MIKHLAIIIPLSVLLEFIVAYFFSLEGEEIINIIKVSLARGITYTIFAVILTGVSSGIYRLIKKEELSIAHLVLWASWGIVIIFYSVSSVILKSGAIS